MLLAWPGCCGARYWRFENKKPDPQCGSGLGPVSCFRSVVGIGADVDLDFSADTFLIGAFNHDDEIFLDRIGVFRIECFDLWRTVSKIPFAFDRTCVVLDNRRELNLQGRFALIGFGLGVGDKQRQILMLGFLHTLKPGQSDTPVAPTRRRRRRGPQGAPIHLPLRRGRRGGRQRGQ